MFFEIDGFAFWLAVLFVGALFLLRRWAHQFSAPMLQFSDLKGLDATSKGVREYFALCPRWLEWFAFTCLLVAFIDPHILVERPNKGITSPVAATQGVALYLVVDRSGSMAEKATSNLSKLELLKQVTEQFVQERPNDLIGLVSFARSAQVLSPLTLDHQELLNQLKEIDFVRKVNEGGTSIGYAIFKTVNLIAATRHYAEDLIKRGKSAYQIQTSAIVLITDGFQDTNPLDKGKRLRTIGIEDAAKYAQENNVKLYLINVEPRIASAQFGPHRRQMERITTLTGGKFFLTSHSDHLSKIYEEINRLEKSVLPDVQKVLAKVSKEKQPHLYRRKSLYPYLLLVGMVALLSAICLRTTIFREIP